MVLIQMNGGRLTKRSTACPVNAGFLGDDLPAIVDAPLSSEVCLSCTVVVSLLSDRSRNGFRDSGLSGAVPGVLLKVVATGDGRALAGDAARLRKGLFDGKFAVRPGDGSPRASVVKDRLLADGRRAGCLGERFSRPMSYLVSCILCLVSRISYLVSMNLKQESLI